MKKFLSTKSIIANINEICNFADLVMTCHCLKVILRTHQSRLNKITFSTRTQRKISFVYNFDVDFKDFYNSQYHGAYAELIFVATAMTGSHEISLSHVIYAFFCV